MKWMRGELEYLEGKDKTFVVVRHGLQRYYLFEENSGEEWTFKNRIEKASSKELIKRIAEDRMAGIQSPF